MHLLLGQLVYTSFAGIGFRLLANEQVPPQIQQAFIDRIVSQHWDSYNPPKPGYRAAYLHQVSPEHSLFGWLYNDGADEIGRYDIPYFVCYHLAGPLHAIRLENIFTCLQKGPVALTDRRSLPETLEALILRNLWSYQAARPGVGIALNMRRYSHIAIYQGKLLNFFVSVDAQQMVVELNGQHKEDEDKKQIQAQIALHRTVQPLNKFAGATKRNTVPVKSLSFAVAVDPESSFRGTVLLPIISTRQILKTGSKRSVLAYRKSQLLPRLGITATVLALIVSIYAILQTSLFASSQPENHSDRSIFFDILPLPTAERHND